MGTEMIVKLLVSIGLGPILAIGATPIVCVLRKIFYLPFAQKSLKKKAVARGHVVQAKLVDEYDETKDYGDSVLIPSGKKYGVYNYLYKGRTYKYRAVWLGSPPEEITLYFLRKPRKAQMDNMIGLREGHWFLYYLALSVLLMILSYTVVVPHVLGI